MSQFLGFPPPYTIPPQASISDVRDNIEALLTSYGWQVVAKSLVPQAITGSFGSGNYLNAYAFDNSDWGTVSSYGEAGGTTALPRNLVVQMPTPVTISSYQVTGHTTGGSAPKSWTLEYSDNGTNWTVADTQANITAWVPCEVKSFTVGGSPGAHLYWRLNVTATNGAGSACYIPELRLHTTSGHIISGQCYLYVMPPATETIGDAYSRELVYIKIDTASITFMPVKQRLVNVPTIVGCYEKTAGAVACSLTIDGVTVTGATGTAGSTAKDNLRALYTAIRASADSNFADHDWYYQKPSPQNANDTNDWIYGIRKSDVPQSSYSVNANTNMVLVMQRTAQKIQTQMTTQMTNTTLTTDLVSGFIFYWQINSRSFHVGTRTNSNFFGLVHCSYADHTKAISAMPERLDPRLLSPLELVVGYDGASTTLDSVGYTSGWWKFPSSTNTAWDSERNRSGATNGDNCFGGGRIRNVFCDGHTNSSPSSIWVGVPNPNCKVAMLGSGVFSGSDGAGDDYQIHRANIAGITNYNASYDSSPNQASSLFVPSLDVQDWFKFRGTATNESLAIIADQAASTTLSAPCNATDTTLNVISTAALQPTGIVVLEQEYIQYTGKTGTTITGCTRGKHGTTAVPHYLGDKVYQGAWLVIFNGGALFAGYVKPS